VEDDLLELFGEAADHFGHEILALEIADNHVHLFVQTDPKHSPADIARQFKSYSAKHLLGCIPRFGSRICGVEDSGRSDTMWERRVRCRKKWLDGISRRQSTKPDVGLRWVGELALETV
jgi:REP element-mobilizing transposase RayT